MNASIVTALAALMGAAIGGLTSVLASWLAQHIQARTQWGTQDRLRRQELYKEFIEEAAKSYIDALQHDNADFSSLVGVYAKVSRMRLLSSQPVLDCAEQIVRKILDTYQEPNKSYAQVREMANSGSFDLFREFGEACREEFETLRAQQI
jgi:hypothetical protein